MGAIHRGNDHDMIGIPCQNIGHLMVPSQLRAYFVQSVHWTCNCASCTVNWVIIYANFTHVLHLRFCPPPFFFFLERGWTPESPQDDSNKEALPAPGDK